jgi:hypothetical protein
MMLSMLVEVDISWQDTGSLEQGRDEHGKTVEMNSGGSSRSCTDLLAPLGPGYGSPKSRSLICFLENCGTFN